MGEISFNYNVNTEPVQEAAFKYWFSESIEYSFAYKRYIAFSDASIFNSPVAITKVATGLSQLHWLFADRNIGGSIYINLIKSLQKSRESTRKESILFNKQQKQDIDTTNNVYAEEIRSGVNIHTENSSTTKDGLVANKNIDKVLNIDSTGLEQIISLSANKGANNLNIYNNLSAEYLYDNSLNEHQQIFATTKNNKLNIISSIELEIINNSSLNVYEILFGSSSDLILNTEENISVKTYNNIANVFQNVSLSSFNNNLNYNKDANVSPINDIILNKFMVHFGARDILKSDSLTDILIKESDVLHSNIVKQINIKNNNTKKDAINNNFIMGYRYDKVGSQFDDIQSAYRNNRTGTKFNNMPSISRNIKQIFNSQQYTVRLGEKHCYVFENAFIDKNLKEVFQNNSMPTCFKGDKNVYTNSDTLLNLGDRQTTASPMVYVLKIGKVSNVDKFQFFITNDKKLIHPHDKPLFIGKAGHSVDAYNQLFIDKNNFNISSFMSTTFTKSSDKMELYHKQDFIIKDEFSIKIYKNYFSVDKERKELILPSENNFILKNENYLNTDNSINPSIQKIQKELVLKNYFLSTYRDSYELKILMGTWAYKDSSKMSTLQQHNVYRDSCCMSILEQCTADIENQRISIFKSGQQVIKSLTTIKTFDFDFVIKKNIPADYSNILTDSFAGMIIPISKVKNHAYIDKIDDMVQKISKEGYIHQDTSVSVLPKKMREQLFELFCDKNEFNLYVDYKNIQITKSKVKSFISTGCSFSKISYPMFITHFDWANKDSQKTWFDTQLDAYKKAQGAFLNDIFDENAGAIKGSRNIYTNNSIFVDKKDKMCYYDYNTTWSDKSSVDAKIYAQMFSDKNNKEAHMLDCISPVIRKDLDGFYDYGVFGNKAIQESHLFQTINDVHKKAYDTKIQPNDFGNWAWVYEDPDPFEGGFGIDELLLPENDTKYEDFEDIIFDKENMVPRHIVKEVNENTFIAKYPIRHPLPKYKDVGIDYEKSAIKLDQFYGIEVSVMHDVFLKFYRIWQAKIFEFGTMTMTQSVKLMLEYLYSWIFIYFPLEKVEQALRVFRLIRWYGETSIIQNSQYIVSYEYDTLESKLNTGTCLIPNDLDTQDTMYVDAALGVIRNNPAHINNGPAYVTFEVNNKKNSTFTFSLSNTIGSVNVYINDVLVDIVSKSALNLTYDLPYTGDTNVVKIEKPAAHNLNSTFYIGNIKVPCCTFKELSIEFDPNLKAGNKPLNEIAKKMISYANLYEDKDAAYEIIRKGNLGVEGIQKQLQEYWKLHHQNKTKGKRLTIKEI